MLHHISYITCKTSQCYPSIFFSIKSSPSSPICRVEIAQVKKRWMRSCLAWWWGIMSQTWTKCWRGAVIGASSWCYFSCQTSKMTSIQERLLSSPRAFSDQYSLVQILSALVLEPARYLPFCSFADEVMVLLAKEIFIPVMFKINQFAKTYLLPIIAKITCTRSDSIIPSFRGCWQGHFWGRDTDVWHIASRQWLIHEIPGYVFLSK